jgi:hypothetical protein
MWKFNMQLVAAAEQAKNSHGAGGNAKTSNYCNDAVKVWQIHIPNSISLQVRSCGWSQ